MPKIDRNKLLFGFLLIIIIAIGEIIFHLLHLPAWPAFLIMIFFFISHMDKKLILNMLAGGAFGILMTIVANYIITLLVTFGLDQFSAFLIFVLVFVYSIVVLGEILPIFFNSYAFMSLLFTTTYMKTPNPQNAIVLTAILLIGGGIFIIAILGIAKIQTKH